MLTNENYFSRENQMKYFSVSQFKAFEKCEASAFAEAAGKYEREKTTALLVGSYVDAHFEGSLDVFKAKNPELFKRRDGNLKSEYIKAEEIIKRAEQDNLFMQYMSGDKQIIMTGEIQGVPVKIKIDSYLPDKIVDLKVMKDFKPIYKSEQGRLNWVEAWEYDLQGAVYQEIVRQNTGKVLPFFLAAVTKEKEPDIAIISVGQEYLDFQLGRVKENIQRYDAVKHGLFEPECCGHCDYCKSVKVLRSPVTLEELDFDYTD